MEIRDWRKKMIRNAPWAKRRKSAITALSVHHDASPRRKGEKMINRYLDECRYHLSLGWPSIGYHYKIDGKGNIYRLNSDNDITYHTGGHNGYTIGICLDGYLHPPYNQKVTKTMEKSLFWLMGYLKRRYKINKKRIYGHRDLNQTACPGDYGYISVLKYKSKKETMATTKELKKKLKKEKAKVEKLNKLLKKARVRASNLGKQLDKKTKKLVKYVKEVSISHESIEVLLKETEDLKKEIKRLKKALSTPSRSFWEYIVLAIKSLKE